MEADVFGEDYLIYLGQIKNSPIDEGDQTPFRHLQHVTSQIANCRSGSLIDLRWRCRTSTSSSFAIMWSGVNVLRGMRTPSHTHQGSPKHLVASCPTPRWHQVYPPHAIHIGRPTLFSFGDIALRSEHGGGYKLLI